MNVYEGGRLPVYHLDLYRLAEGAVYDLGLEEILDRRAVVVVEWAERLGAFPVPNAVHIEISDEGDDRRRIVVR